MTKGERALHERKVAEQEAFFVTLGGAQRPMIPLSKIKL
jgi:hypothetical protein